MNNKPSNAVANWLIIGALMVAGIVITGGITRLTNSGLSMVTWEPISGIVPPLNQADWLAEFENYKTSPEFKIKNNNFDLDNFKQIFWWEYIHRVLARVIGLVFVFPFLYFLFTKKLRNRKLLKHLLIIFVLGGFQGFLGWFMVSSGLVEKPEVNHFRLAAHLLAALSLFAYILWIALHIKASKTDTEVKIHNPFRQLLRLSFVMIVIQITYGAFMAGLKAGFFFPTFPKMGDSWLPQVLSSAFSEEGFLAIVNNPFVVQFIHRWIPAIIFIIGALLWYRIEKSSDPNSSKKWIIRAFNFMILIQIILGVYTILFSVPLHLGVLHQFGAVVLFGINLLALFSFRSKNIF